MSGRARSFQPQQPQLTLMDIEYLLRKYNRATWATLSVAKTLREPQFGGAHQGGTKKVNMPTKLVLAVSAMNEQIKVSEMYEINELTEAFGIKEHELRRMGFTMWDLPNMLLDTTLRAQEGENEMIYDRVEEREEDVAGAYWGAAGAEPSKPTEAESEK